MLRTGPLKDEAAVLMSARAVNARSDRDGRAGRAEVRSLAPAGRGNGAANRRSVAREIRVGDGARAREIQ